MPRATSPGPLPRLADLKPVNDNPVPQSPRPAGASTARGAGHPMPNGLADAQPLSADTRSGAAGNLFTSSMHAQAAHQALATAPNSTSAPVSSAPATEAA
eukprot:CAMPEP_0206143756 /NCGR_PEP_ID=MMETSP1473-20131121/21711_1 /ASSEMBLY_ACC=CAM_ASM_001109 /TAXON_ID=1461547 /ORGANISM="Stichococcus sp, Strain RCC1054" /LENGTH=99 /DNA_ID=CAMNT_0053539305 /DNA_START=1 /DNA_END=297 /DNA_ORIENTATION=-